MNFMNITTMRTCEGLQEVSMIAHSSGFSVPVFLSERLLIALTPETPLRLWGVHPATNIKALLDMLLHLSRDRGDDLRFDFAVARWDPANQSVTTRDLKLASVSFPVEPIPFIIVSLADETVDLLLDDLP